MSAYTIVKNICAFIGAWFIIACAVGYGTAWARHLARRRYLRRMEALGHLPRTYWREGEE